MKPQNYRCVTTDAVLRVFSDTITAVAGGDTQINFVIPTQRGNAVGFDFVIANNTIADLAGATVSLKVNGDDIIEEDALIAYSPIYQDKESFIPVRADGGSRIRGRINVPGATDLVVTVRTYFNGDGEPIKADV